MSWFTSLFTLPTPNDARPCPQSSTTASPPAHEKRILEEAAVTAPSKLPSSTSSTTINPNRNKVIFAAGFSFFAFSLLITRRSFVRRRLATRLPQSEFYSDAPTHTAAQSTKVSGAMEAVEALNIATINVLSLAMMGVGGGLWYLDINSMDEARRLLRGGLGVDGTGRDEKEAEEDFEEWIAKTLARGETKEKVKAGRILEEEGGKKKP